MSESNIFFLLVVTSMVILASGIVIIFNDIKEREFTESVITECIITLQDRDK